MDSEVGKVDIIKADYQIKGAIIMGVCIKLAMGRILTTRRASTVTRIWSMAVSSKSSTSSVITTLMLRSMPN